MIPLPLTALHDTLNAGDEPCTVLVTVTPCTLGVGDGGQLVIIGVGRGVPVVNVVNAPGVDG